MSEHLRDISTYYFLDIEDKKDVKPISEIDCEIVSTLISIVERLGLEILVNTLSKWKLSPDREILTELEEYLSGEEIEEEMTKKGGIPIEKLLDKMKRSYIKIGDRFLMTNSIYIISKSDSHNGQRPTYSIVVNDEKYLSDKLPLFMNITTSFHNEDERDSEIERIKKLMKLNTMCKFLE